MALALLPPDRRRVKNLRVFLWYHQLMHHVDSKGPTYLYLNLQGLCASVCETSGWGSLRSMHEDLVNYVTGTRGVCASMRCQYLKLGVNWKWVPNQLCSRETMMLRKSEQDSQG